LVLLAVFAVGCTQIIALQAPSNQVIKDTYQVTVTVTPGLAANEARGVFSFRYPGVWDVASVRYSVNGGADVGAIPVGNFDDYFSTEWEAKTPESAPEVRRHNGPKPGGAQWDYVWWSGYSWPGNWQADDEIVVTVTFNTNYGSVGINAGDEFLLDFVSGFTPDADPFNPDNELWWEGGDAPTGEHVRLDIPVRLHSFNDVLPSDHYYPAIEALANFNLVHGLADRPIINGYDKADGTRDFRPDNNVARAQFAKMMINVLGTNVDETMGSPFTDLGPDDPVSIYHHEYIAAIWEAGITLGTTPTTFEPWANISRAQVITMVVRAIQEAYPAALAQPPAGYQSMWGAFDPNHGPMAAKAEFNGLLDDLQVGAGAQVPWQPMSREEISQVLWNMLKLVTPPGQLF